MAVWPIDTNKLLYLKVLIFIALLCMGLHIIQVDIMLRLIHA